MINTREKIFAALTKLGTSKPKPLAKEVGESASVVSYHLCALLKEGKVAKKAGSYSLPSQPPPSPANGNGKGKRASPGATAADEYTFAMTTDTRLVILATKLSAPVILTAQQTERLATLMQAHFESTK